MDLIYATVAIFAWIIVRISIADALIRRRLGLTWKPVAEGVPTMYRYGWVRQPSIYWCEPLDELQDRLVLRSRAHLWLQSVVVVASWAWVAAIWLNGAEGLAFVLWFSLALIELGWLLSNVMATSGGYLSDLRANESPHRDVASGVAYQLLTTVHAGDRPRDWPRELVDVFALPEQSPHSRACSAAMRYTWANDFGDEAVKESSVADMASALDETGIPPEVRAYTAAVLAFDLVSRGDVVGARERVVEAKKDRASSGLWLSAAEAWIAMREGNKEDAGEQLESVWLELNDSDAMCAYALDQIRRIMPEFVPPSA
jgi:hypothetical protein